MIKKHKNEQKIIKTFIKLKNNNLKIKTEFPKRQYSLINMIHYYFCDFFSEWESLSKLEIINYRDEIIS